MINKNKNKNFHSKCLRNTVLRLFSMTFLVTILGYSSLVFSNSLEENKNLTLNINNSIEGMSSTYSNRFNTGNFLVVAGKIDGSISVSLWKASFSEEAQIINEESTQSNKGPIKTIAVSSDGETVVSSSYSSEISWWKIKEDLTLEEKKPTLESEIGSKNTDYHHDAFINFLTVSPDGKKVISASDDENLIIWDARTHKGIRKLEGGHTNGVTSVAFSPDIKFGDDGKILQGYIVSGCEDSKVRLWNSIEAGNSEDGHRNTITSVAFSLDGRKVISGSADGRALLWKISDGRLIEIGKWEQSDPITSVAFSFNGRKVAVSAGNKDDMIHLLSVDESLDDALTSSISSKKDSIKLSISNIVFLPNGVIVSGGKEGKISFWNEK